LAANNHRAAIIKRAAAFTSTRHTSTDHVLSDSARSGKCIITFWTGIDEYIDSLEL
jgi:hypothetical protein